MELNPIAFEKASPLCVGPSRRFFMAELRMTRLRNPDCYLGDLVEGERFPSAKRVLKRWVRLDSLRDPSGCNQMLSDCVLN
jgi:hypothetical protein